VGIREQQKTFLVTVLCKVMLVSTSAFYAWSKAPEETDKKHCKNSLKLERLSYLTRIRKRMALAAYPTPSTKKLSRSGALKPGN
jgi:hypothetical protein